MGKKIIVCVISDLVTDQRVLKECATLHTDGYEVLLIGRRSTRDWNTAALPYSTKRLTVPFKRGVLMYVYFNLLLFFHLLFSPSAIYWSNDLDTLLPAFLVSRLKQKPLVYDSHEYFTESVVNPVAKKVWSFLERLLFPRLKNVITVNASIKDVYEKKYRVPVTIIRNVPLQLPPPPDVPILFPGKKMLLIQGMGINENRGAEEAVTMMEFLPADFILCFIGSGTVINKLKEMSRQHRLQARVHFIDPLPYASMMSYTRQAYLGLNFEKISISDQHLFSLPNKFFDFIHAGVPVLSTRAVEVEALIKKYDTGFFVDDTNPRHLAEAIMAIAQDPIRYEEYKHNTSNAAAQLNWQQEEKILTDFMSRIR